MTMYIDQFMDRKGSVDPEFFSIFGAEDLGGYHAEGDIQHVTTDGTDVNALWATFQATMAIYNEHQAALVQLLTFPVQNLVETVPQVGEAEFEMASEFGLPKANRIELKYFQMGYDFDDYDTRIAYTWKFIRDADARQVEAIHNANLTADGRLVFRKVMEALFDNRNRDTDIREQNFKVYPLYNADGTVPPDYKGKTFSGTHSHYMVSGNALIDSSDLEDAYENIREHGYGIENGTTFVWLGNRAQIKEIRKFRQGAVSNNGVVANYDFIPSANQPALILPNSEGLLGSRPPNTWNGLQVVGSYGDILIIEEAYIPEGYSLMFGTGGEGDLQNLVGLREHANEAYRGLRMIPGNQQRYPLLDSYYSRGFGTGVRQRAGGVIMQYKTGVAADYTIPEQYKKGTGLN